MLLETLRQATDSAHQRLHVHPCLAPLSGKAITRDCYTTALKKFYGFYAGLEKSYAASGSEILAKFPAGENISRLKKDLENADVNTKEIPVMRDGLKISSPEAVVAYLYIREGSKLGGQVISKNLQQVLSLQPETHNSYFWGEGKNTSAR